MDPKTWQKMAKKTSKGTKTRLKRLPNFPKSSPKSMSSYSALGDVALEAVDAIVLSRSEEHLSANSSASIQHLPAALLGALK